MCCRWVEIVVSFESLWRRKHREPVRSQVGSSFILDLKACDTYPMESRMVPHWTPLSWPSKSPWRRAWQKATQIAFLCGRVNVSKKTSLCRPMERMNSCQRRQDRIRLSSVFWTVADFWAVSAALSRETSRFLLGQVSFWNEGCAVDLNLRKEKWGYWWGHCLVNASHESKYQGWCCHHHTSIGTIKWGLVRGWSWQVFGRFLIWWVDQGDFLRLTWSLVLPPIRLHLNYLQVTVV